MSGIYGQISISPLQINDNINRMHLWNSLYGRNSEAVHSGDNFFLGCCYDSDMDIEGVSAYPVLNASENLHAVIDAVVYNRKEITEALSNAGVAINSPVADNALLLSYIDTFGYDALKNVNGDFAGVVYDTSKNEVTLFRDHLGVRPLFYYAKDGLLAFSTDIRSLLSTDNIPAELAESWLYKTISGLNRVCNNETEYENIFCVVPSTYLTIKLSDCLSIYETPYWSPRQKKIRYKSEKEYFDKLRELITNAIKIRADICPGRIGSELSGGLDSSVISIILNRIGANATYYSWSPSPESLPLVKNDERLDIAELCTQEGITCNYGSINIRVHKGSDVFIESEKLLGENFESQKGVAAYLFPPYCNTFDLCETANFMREHGVKMVFTGHGGDEGVSHRSAPYEIYYNREYLSYFKYMWNLSKGNRSFPRHVAAFTRDTYRSLKVSKKNASIIKVDIVSTFEAINHDFGKKMENTHINIFDFMYSPAHYITNGGVRPRFDNVALYGAYSNVRYVAPYLDYRVVDYALSIPRALYLRGTKKRYIFRETFKDILPECIYKLHTKATASTDSIEPKKRDLSEILQAVLDNIDKDKWSKYLNVDKLYTLCDTGNINGDSEKALSTPTKENDSGASNKAKAHRSKENDDVNIEDLKKGVYKMLAEIFTADATLDSIKKLKL